MSCLLQLFYLSTLAHEPLLIIYNIILKKYLIIIGFTPYCPKPWQSMNEDYCISEVVHKIRA